MYLLEHRKDPDVEWTVAALRHGLHHEISILRSLGPPMQPYIFQGYGQQEMYHSPVQSPVSRGPSLRKLLPATGSALSVIEQKKVPWRPCVFCEEMHFPDDCQAYPTFESRLEIYKNKGAVATA